ncbi:MAG: nucleoside monophosphate kinase [bacterium]
MKNIIFIAAPASGKGSISKLLEENNGYVHLATGDILRERVEAGDKFIKDLIDNGKFVSDEIITSIIKEKINTLKDTPFILDGVPRTLIQTKMLDKIFQEENINNVVVIKLNITLEVSKERISGRYICKCGRSYNLNTENLKPKVEGICDKCGSKLLQRNDDTEEKIEKRFNDYVNNLEPIVEFYKKQNMLYEIDGRDDINKIYELIKEIIND